MPGFFISYRRDDSAGHAGRLHDRLIENFGRENIFIDVETIGIGVDFLEAIREAIQATDGLIAVIGREWLSATDSSGDRRLDNPQDFVRLEIATAFELGVRVIPVLVQGASPPRADDLPDNLRQIAGLNALEISDSRFHTDVDRLIEALGNITLEQASQLAITTAETTPGEYGDEFNGVSMSFEVVETNEIDDQYLITLSFQPEGQSRGAPGREQFFIEKGGHVDRRQVISIPGRANKQRNPLVFAALSLIAIVGVVVVVVALAGGGDDASLPTAAEPSLTPEAPSSQRSSATAAVSPTGSPSTIVGTITLELEPSQIMIEAGGALDLTAIASDESGRPIIDPEIQWNIAPEAGAISADGVLTAGTRAGAFLGAIQLTVDQGLSSGQATFDLIIEPGPLDSVEVLPAAAALIRGESVQFSLVGSDSYGNAVTGLEVSWESAEGLSVDGGGLVTAGPRVAPSPLPGLLGWWPGDGNAEDEVADQNGSASAGVDYSSGVYGQAFRLDGINDVVSIHDFDFVEFRDDVSVHLWAKRDVLSGPAVLVIKGAGTRGGVDIPTAFILKFGSRVSPVGDGSYLWGGFETSNGTDVFLVGPQVSDRLFHHYAYVRAGNIHMLYLDGVEVVNRSFTGRPGSTSGEALMIGAGPSGGQTGQPFEGTIDEVQVFDRALTAAEVERIFTAADGETAYQISAVVQQGNIERTVSVEVVVRD